jgi:hypothetical protein
VIDKSVIEAGLRQQGVWCGEFGSAFTASLCARLADDYRDGGIVADILDGWPTDPIKDALALRLTGALHHHALSDPDGALAQVWPKASDGWSMDDAWQVAEATMKARAAWVAEFIKSPPKPMKCAAQLACFRGFVLPPRVLMGPLMCSNWGRQLALI